MGRETPAAERISFLSVLSLLLERIVHCLAVAVGDGHVQVLVLLAELHGPDVIVGKEQLAAFACELDLGLGPGGIWAEHEVYQRLSGFLVKGGVCIPRQEQSLEHSVVCIVRLGCPPDIHDPCVPHGGLLVIAELGDLVKTHVLTAAEAADQNAADYCNTEKREEGGFPDFLFLMPGHFFEFLFLDTHRIRITSVCCDY